MIVSVEKSEHFALLRVNAQQMEDGTLHELLTNAQAVLQEHPYKYLIFDLSKLEDFPDQAYEPFLNLAVQMQEEMGLLISFNGQPFLLHTFEEKGLVLVPTENEAIEFVFMDQLEKQFLDDIE